MSKPHGAVRRLTAVAVAAGMALGAVAAATTARAAGPLCADFGNTCIDSYTVTPGSVPNDRDSTVTVSMHLSSGAPSCVQLSQSNDLNGEVDVTLDLTQAAPGSATWTTSYVVKAHNRPGTYVPNSVHFCGGGDIDGQLFPTLGSSAVLTVTGTDDTAAPVVRSFSITPASADTTLRAAAFSVTARVTDGYAGTTSVALGAETPAGPAAGGYHGGSAGISLTRTAGTGLDGTYTGTLTLPAGTSGTWSLQLYTADQMGNTGGLSNAGLGAAGLPNKVVTRTTAAPPTPTNVSASSGISIGTAGNVTHSVSVKGTAQQSGKPAATDWLVTTSAGCGSVYSSTPGLVIIAGGGTGWKLCTYTLVAVNGFGQSKAVKVTALI